MQINLEIVFVRFSLRSFWFFNHSTNISDGFLCIRFWEESFCKRCGHFQAGFNIRVRVTNDDLSKCNIVDIWLNVCSLPECYRFIKCHPNKSNHGPAIAMMVCSTLRILSPQRAIQTITLKKSLREWICYIILASPYVQATLCLPSNGASSIHTFYAQQQYFPASPILFHHARTCMADRKRQKQ